MAPPQASIRAFQYGLGIFALTALLGLANATQLFGALDRNTLLTHLHSGTLGWITMGVIGLTAWMFGASAPTAARNVMLSALATAGYVLAFWSGNFQARAIFGTIELIVILYWWWFAVSSGMREGFGRLDIPKLSVIFGLTTLVIGSTIGVTVQIILGTGNSLPGNTDLVGGHASAQIGGYLVLVAAGFAEWQLSGRGKRSGAGLAQVGILFIGGLLLSGSVLLGSALGPQLAQALPGIATLLTLLGIAIVAIRFGLRAIGTPWGSPTGTRHVAIAVGFLALGGILETILVQQFIAAQGDVSKVSVGLFHALDHTMFVGLMTNILFGAILIATADRPRVWPWADHVIFWGLNIGVASFIVVLLTQGSGEGSKPFTSAVAYTAPIMGLSALLGIVTLSMRLVAERATMRAPAPA